MVGTHSIHSVRRNSVPCETESCHKQIRQNLTAGWYEYSMFGLRGSGVSCRMFHQACAIPEAEMVSCWTASEERRVISASKGRTVVEGATQRSQSEAENLNSSPGGIR